MLKTTSKRLAWIGATLCALLPVITGCVQSTIQDIREARSDLRDDQSVVILSRKHKTQGETEDDFIACVADYVANGSGKLSVMHDQDFVDAVFPWFEPRTAPLNMRDLAKIISRPMIATRIREIGVRYLVWIEGTTERSDEAGSMQCAVIAGGVPACFGFLSWENGSDYEASIWDVTKGITVGRISSESVGTSFIPAVVVPIPFIAPVRQQACTNLADQLKQFIDSEA